MAEKDLGGQGINGPKQFKLDDPRQIRIYTRLNDLLSPGLAKFFLDACKLRFNPSEFHTASHLLAHLLREVESGIRAVNIYSEKENILQENVRDLIESAKKILKTGPEDVKLKGEHFSSVEDLKNVLERIKSGVEINEEKLLNHRRQIKVVGATLKISEKILEAWSGLLDEDFFASQAHRSSLEDPRDPKESEHLYENVEVIFDEVLDAFEKSFGEILKKVDVLLEAGPSKENVSRFKNRMPKNYVCHNHFFSKNNDPAWLPFLRGKDLFKDPVANLENKEEGTVQFVAWPQSEYLARMAGKEPASVKDIVLEMQDTDNPSVLCDLVNIATNLPVNISIELIDQVKKWAHNPYQSFSLLDEKLGDLTWYWAQGGMHQQSLDLLEILFQENAKLDNTSSSWQFGQFIKKYYKKLVEKLGLPGMMLVVESLDTAKNTRPYGEESFMDGSLIWFPSIKNISIEERENVEGNLIAGLKVGWEVIKEDPVAKRGFIEKLLEKNRALFYRIATHLMSMDSDGIEDLVVKALKNFEAMDGIEEFPEYGELLEAFFQKLSPEDRKVILEHVKSGPLDNQKYEESLTKEYGAEKAKSSIALRTKNWQKNVLVWIKDLLEEDERKEITEESDGGQKYHGGRSSMTSFVGPTSPYTDEQLSAMDFEQLREVLENWEPDPKTPRDEFGFGPSKEGLGRVLTGVAKKNLPNFSKNASKFKGLSLEYTEGLFRGFREGIKEKEEELDWDQVLDLAQWAVQQTPFRGAARKDDQLRVGLRMSIVSLLLGSLQGSDPRIPIENRKSVWAILEELMKDPDPTPERDKKESNSKLDDYNTAINSIRGEALQCVMTYAFWVKEKQGTKDFSFKEIPEVRQVLEEHLLPADSSRAVRAVYGRMFPFIASLDPDWAQTNATIVFSGELLPDEISSAAWKTYLLIHPSRRHTFAILKPQYEQALENLKQKGSSELEDFEEAFIGHVMGLFWNEVITLEDKMLVDLFNIPNGKITKAAIDSLGRHGLHAEKNGGKTLEDSLIERLIGFYQERLKDVESRGESFDSETLEDYGWWFISGFLKEEISLELLRRTLSITKGQIDPDHLVIEKLEELTARQPLLVAQCLDLIAQNTKEKWVILGNKDKIKTILGKLFETGQPDVISVAEGIIGRLSSKGYTDFLGIKESS